MKQDKKQQIRKKIWKMPFLVDELFKDDDWSLFDGTTAQHKVPTGEMKKRIQTAIQAAEQRLEKKAVRKYRLMRLIRYSAAAAILVFFSFHFITWWIKDEEHATKDRAVALPQAVMSDTSWTFIENRAFAPMRIKLADGSHVKLFAKSCIRYRKVFTPQARDIELIGKAYFDVASDAERPFSVYAGGTKTTALGTSFTIQTGRKKRAVTVALHTGKVLVASVDHKFKAVFLKSPGQRLSVDNFGLTREHIPVKKRIEQKELYAESPVDLLDLKNTPMPLVLQALERTFKLKLHIGDRDIADIHYTGQIDVHKDQVKDILTTICLINELRYVANADGSYTLYKQDSKTNEHLNN